MTQLDKTWAVKEIEMFLRVMAQIRPQTRSGGVYIGTVMQDSPTEASERAYVVEKILDRTIPG